MKYSIIAAVIAVTITVLLLFFNNGLTKQDKFILIVLIILLSLTGGYFTIKALKKEDVENLKQGVTLDNTLNNTETLKLKADSIITNINESLDNVIRINDTVVGFNKSLKKVQKDVAIQIKMIENTLVQTKKFEEKLAEQLKIEKLRFQSESANIIIPAKNVMFLPSQKDSNLVALHSKTYNRGKRNARNVNSTYLLLLLNDKKEVFKHEFMSSFNEFITPGDAATLESRPMFSKKDFGNKINSVIIAIQVKYNDESNDILIQTDFIFRWNNLVSDELIFSNAEKQDKKIALDYIRVNNL